MHSDKNRILVSAALECLLHQGGVSDLVHYLFDAGDGPRRRLSSCATNAHACARGDEV